MKQKIFTGLAGRTVKDTIYQYRETDNTPENAPNVLYILLDDMGFAQLGCYGSHIHTPNIDRLASEGLRYNNFHTTAICSATRASLLTGANHHTAGICALCDTMTGCDNAAGRLKPEYATIAEILKEYGYATYAAGKWHLDSEQSVSGNPTGWPLQKGFDRYYGFLHGLNDQYHPNLLRDNTKADQPKTVEEGYHFSEDITDNAITYLFEHTMNYPEQPFFLYLAFGAMHSPHQAPKEYVDRYKGKFDEGWDVLRQRWYDKQKRIGLIPENAELTDRNAYVQAWDSLSEKEKAVYVRSMETFAGMLEHTDAQIGRVLDYLEQSGQLDHTVIFFLSDNGASSEGGIQGRFNSMNGMDMTSLSDSEIDYAYEHLEEFGSEYSFSHYPTGWANLGNTPFPWYKVWAHEGGTKDPLIIRYPALIKDPGAVRSQYHHVSDLTPTVLDILGVEKPKEVKGVTQKPFTGISLRYTLENPDAPDERHIQYYEVFGNRAIYKDGWKAVVNHAFSEDYSDDQWELYHVAEDYSEKYNVADRYPGKLRELQEDFMHEAGKYGVFPMMLNSMNAKPENIAYIHGIGTSQPEKISVFRHVIQPFEVISARNIDSFHSSHVISARIYRESEQEEGVLYSSGSRFGGSSFYLKDNLLHYVYNANEPVPTEIHSDIPLPAGELDVSYFFLRKGKGAQVRLYVNGKRVGSGSIEKIGYMNGFSSSIKANFYSPVTSDYKVPFAFGGRIDEIILRQFASEVDPEEEIRRLMHAE